MNTIINANPRSNLDVTSMTEMKYCPICHKEVDVEYVAKPDVDLKVCKNCGAAVSIRYKDY
jgi:NMD protein affecting ribosome stability and mRNA decay